VDLKCETVVFLGCERLVVLLCELVVELVRILRYRTPGAKNTCSRHSMLPAAGQPVLTNRRPRLRKLDTGRHRISGYARQSDGERGHGASRCHRDRTAMGVDD
jgi:hypothetical protein